MKLDIIYLFITQWDIFLQKYIGTYILERVWKIIYKIRQRHENWLII